MVGTSNQSVPESWPLIISKNKIIPARYPKQWGGEGDETSGGDDDDDDKEMRALRSRHMRAPESRHIRAHIWKHR